MMHNKKHISLGILCASITALILGGCSNESSTSIQEDPILECNCETGENCTDAEKETCKKVEPACPAECPNDCTGGVCNTHEECPAECPNDCTDGVCNKHEECPAECPNDCTYGVCNKHEECPAECPNDCTDGVCNTHDECPAECPNDCTDGVCNTHDECPAECPNDCTDGVCNTHDECPAECPNDCTDGVCNTHEECPAECPNDCTDGVCNTHEECPAECPNDCTDGVCNTVVECPTECPGSCDDDGECPKKECPAECPDNCYSSDECTHEDNCPKECPDNCTNGVCNTTTICPEDCPDNCDEEGICPSVSQCPTECPDNCNADLSCPDYCPSECPGICDEQGKCPATCPATCPDDCDSNGMCVCPSNCQNGCVDNSLTCQCPTGCKNGCNEKNGTCKCPTICQNGCDTNGACKCPSDCTNGCDTATGTCKCPSTCATSCNEKGECPIKCGDETVKSMYFSYKELDLLTPDSSSRKAANMTVYIKTDKNTYNMDTAPCKADIQLSIANENVATVVKNTSTPKYATFTSAGPGSTVCTVKLKGQTGITGSIKINVLSLDKLDTNLAAKNSSNKYIHVYKHPLAMYSTSRVAQAFDYYNKDEFMYFSQLPKPQVLKTKDNKVAYDNTEVHVFTHNYTNRPKKSMLFYASGHGQNLSIEHTSSKDYVWMGNYGTLMCDETNTNCPVGYKQSQVISRVAYEEGKSMYPADSTENYYYKDKNGSYYYSFEPALDTKNGKFAFRAYYAKDKRAYLRIYHLNNVKAIANSTFKLPNPIQWINKDNEFIQNDRPTITGKDLASISPINEFSKQALAVQGMELENGIVYTVTGVLKKLATPEGPNGKYIYKSEISIYVYKMDGNSIGGPKATQITRNGGKEYVYYLNTSKEKQETIEYMEGETKKTYTGYFLNNAELDEMFNYTKDDYKFEHTGYVEPEGIRVDNGKLYLNLTIRYKRYKDGVDQGGTLARQAIIVYDLL